MSASQPATGGVRSLRAMFENSEATSSSPEPRGRSPASIDTNNSRHTSKVRSSFISVESSTSFPRDITSARSTSRSTHPASPSIHRRESFGLRKSEDLGAANQLRETMSAETEQRQKDATVAEVVPEQAVETESKSEAANLSATNHGSWNAAALPNFPLSTANVASAATAPKSSDVVSGSVNVSQAPVASKPPVEVEAPTSNPDKITSVGEETPAVMKPSDPTDAKAVSGGEALAGEQEALPSLAKDVSAPEPTPSIKANGNAKASIKKPSAISTAPTAAAGPKSATKTTNTSKSPATTVRSPATASVTSPIASNKPTTATKTSKPAEKAPRQSLASASAAKPRPKSPTRPVKLPSHLTAPTASSAAKKDDSTAAPTVTKKPSVVGRDRSSGASVTAKPVGVKKPASRPSLPVQPAKRPESRTSTAAPDSGFLARMMRPTASSANKTHEKVDVKSPPRGKPAPSAKPKAPVGSSTSTASKVKAKLDETVNKAKDKLTPNGSADKQEVDDTTAARAADENGEPKVAVKSGAEQGTGEATPDVTSTDLSAETPQFEGATIR